MNSPVSKLPPLPVAPAAKPPVIELRPRRRVPWGLLVLLLLVAGGWAAWRWRSQNAEKTDVAFQAAVRTATVSAGTVERTLRITGVTAAERFVSLITPQMRANRGGRNRDGNSSQQTQQASMGSVPPLPSGRSGSGAGGRSGSTPSGSSSGGASSGDSGTTVTSTASAVTGASGTQGSSSSTGYSAPSSTSAFQAATSRIGSSGTSRPSSTNSSRSGTSGSTSQALGTDGLGSTSSQLNQGTPGGGGGGGAPGGGGGGGGIGGNDFMLVLQELIKPGSRVKKGETVAEFDRQYMLQRFDDYKSSVAQQAANLKKLKAELELYRESHRQTISTAKADLDKARLDMKTVPVLSAIDAERAKLALDEAEAQYKQLLSEVKFVEVAEKAQIRNAELDLKSSELELKRAEQNADRMVSRAAIDGMTVMQNTFRGAEFAQIQQGDQLFPGQFFMQIVDTSSMVINATLNQVDSERLRIGAKAVVRFDAYPDLELPAHVIAVAAVTKAGGFRASYVKEIPVRLKLDKIDPRVIPDLSVSADILIEAEDAAAVVPLVSVFREGQEARPFVYIREGDAWRRRPVELGAANYVSASVRSGLKPGEVVALETPPKIPGA